MVVLNILAGGSFGGIETLCLNLNNANKYTNCFLFLKNKGDMFDEIAKINNKVLYFSLNSNINKNIKIIKEKCLEWGVDIIANHYDCWYTVLYYSKLIKALKNVPGVNFIHYCYEKNNELPFYKRIFYWYWRVKAFKTSKYAIFVSNAGLESYKPYYKYMKKINKKAVIYNGINDNYIIEGLKIKKEFKKNNLLYLGRITEEKGIENLILACQILTNKKVEYCCSIVGDGKDFEKYYKLSKKLNLPITFYHGTKIPKMFYEENNIFVYPSIWKEIFGISIVEAMAFGLIPIVNKLGGLPEIITDSIDGFFTNESSASSLADTIIKVINLTDAEKYKISLNAKKRASHFDILNTAENYRKFFNYIISQNKDENNHVCD